jgi:hypothetical protein
MKQIYIEKSELLMTYKKLKGDVSWYRPNSKLKEKPLAYSTIATSNLIACLSMTNRTIKDVYDAINYDEEAKSILNIYIEKGYGDVVAQTIFKL